MKTSPLSVVLCALVFAGVVCENGVCRLTDEPSDNSSAVLAGHPDSASVALPEPTRMLQGATDEETFCAFLAGEAPEDPFAGRTLAFVLLLAVLGGLAMNLTPCVLPMVPVNLLVIGSSLARGLLYGLGQLVAFGALGLLAAFGGVAFGTIQSSPWFNLGVAALFVLLALALAGAFALDFTRLRAGLKGGAFFLGVLSAVLAGACIAPVLVSVLLLTAKLYAEGRPLALALPFAVGLGLALPWPFLGAGLRVLPKPGAWMRWVNHAFAVFVLALAVHYGLLAVRGFGALALASTDLTVEEFRRGELFAAPRSRPLLVYCHASWCKNCPAMERLMASSPKIRTALEGTDVVRLDAEDPSALRTLPGFGAVRGLPAFALYGLRND